MESPPFVMSSVVWRSSITKWAALITQERFDLGSPNFTGISMLKDLLTALPRNYAVVEGWLTTYLETMYLEPLIHNQLTFQSHSAVTGNHHFLSKVRPNKLKRRVWQRTICFAANGNELVRDMDPHSFTCHPTAATFTPWSQKKLVLDLPTPKGWNGVLQFAFSLAKPMAQWVFVGHFVSFSRYMTWNHPLRNILDSVVCT